MTFPPRNVPTPKRSESGEALWAEQWIWKAKDGAGSSGRLEALAGNTAVPDMRLELVPIPVSDVDRAKAFYQQAGFGNLHDTQVTDTMRVVQLTPPGSSCAIVFGTGMGPITDMTPGSVKGIHLVVADMAATRAALTARDIELSDVDDMGGVLYSYFSDPDGNLWALQQWPAGSQP